jgi:hypothetical protein
MVTQMSTCSFLRWAVSHEEASEMQCIVLNICDNWNIFVSVAHHQRYPYFDVVVGLAWSHDPQSYHGGSDATFTASRARQVMTQTKRDTLVLQVGGWAWGWQSHPVKHICQETSKIGNWMETTKMTQDEQGLTSGNGTRFLCIEVAYCRTWLK